MPPQGQCGAGYNAVTAQGVRQVQNRRSLLEWLDIRDLRTDVIDTRHIEMRMLVFSRYRSSAVFIDRPNLPRADRLQYRGVFLDRRQD